VTAGVVLAVNPTAGKGRGARAGAIVASRLAADRVPVRAVTGTSGPDLSERAREALAEGGRALVVVGGDGMVHLGTNLVAGTEIPLGIVPAGTGNDVAREFGLILGDPDAAARDVVRAIQAGSVRVVDAARCPAVTGPSPEGDRWFAGVLGAGFDAIVNERANGWRWPRGHLRYDLAILRELPVLRPREYRLVLDGQCWETAALMVAIGNGTAYGGGMHVCPDAVMDDGLLDVIVVRPLSRTAFVRLYPKVYAGTHVSDPRVEVRRARRVEVASPGIVAYADGERLGPLPIVAEAVPGALHVLTAPTG
jgi:diacylglycerol kinase (ATP)